MSGVSGPFAIPSVVSGAEKAVKDLEQLAAADPEALIDSIEELLPLGTSQDAGVATGVSAGLVSGVTGLADPVLSKGNGSLTQPQGGVYTPAVKCGAELLYCCAAQERLLYPGSAFTPLVAPKPVPFPLLVTLRQVKFPFHTSSTQQGHVSQLSRGSTRCTSRLTSASNSK